MGALNSPITMGYNFFLKPTLILMMRASVFHVNFQPMLEF